MRVDLAGCIVAVVYSDELRILHVRDGDTGDLELPQQWITVLQACSKEIQVREYYIPVSWKYQVERGNCMKKEQNLPYLSCNHIPVYSRKKPCAMNSYARSSQAVNGASSLKKASSRIYTGEQFASRPWQLTA